MVSEDSYFALYLDVLAVISPAERLFDGFLQTNSLVLPVVTSLHRCALRFAEINGVSIVLVHWYVHFAVKKWENLIPSFETLPRPPVYMYIPKGMLVIFVPEVFARSSPFSSYF